MKNTLMLGSNLLGALQERDRDLVRPHLQHLVLSEGQVLYEPGDDVQYAYFPRHDALVGFLVPMTDGEAVESALIGREGAAGGIVSRGHVPAFARCSVVQGGDFFRMSSNALETLKRQSSAIDDLFTRYADCLLAQVFQSAACNARHSIEQRTARWLVAAMSRTGSTEITLTQAKLGALLGVGRSYVARVIGRFRREGIVATGRGGLRISDPRRLRAIACDCTQVIVDHFDTVLRGVYPHAAETHHATAVAKDVAPAP